MILHPSFSRGKQRRQQGLTLVEIMVATALLMFISLGLTMLFNQTQKAFRAGMRQVDVLDAGRAATEMIARDIELGTRSEVDPSPNFYSGIIPGTDTSVNDALDGTTLRSNVLYELFVLSNETNWQGTGFSVFHPLTPKVKNIFAVGSLYRYSSNRFDSPDGLYLGFFNAPDQLINEGKMRRVMDGVIHFRTRTFDTNGREVTNSLPNIQVTTVGTEMETRYFSNTLPAMVEIELGVLEPQTYEQLKPILASNNKVAAAAFIKRNGGKVHIFRQQVPIRQARK